MYFEDEMTPKERMIAFSKGEAIDLSLIHI